MNKVPVPEKNDKNNDRKNRYFSEKRGQE